MSANLSRAQLLLAQSRPADAEREAMLALAAEPEDTDALALLAISLGDQQKGKQAMAAAEKAVGLAPDNSYLHYVRAFTLHRSDENDLARSALQESLRLEPENAEAFSLLAAIELARGDWKAALKAAEQVLQMDPEHVRATNFRAMALVHLGRKGEATESVDFALHRAPDNALSHANQGWNYLHKNNPRRAQEFFREALRLEPNMEYARRGMLDALRARNPIYRGMLAYFLWMGRQGSHLQWGIMIATYFFSRFLGTILEAHPDSSALIALAIVFYSFGYLTWTAQPMFNLLLCFDRFGRHVLSRDERYAAFWFGLAFSAMLGCLVWWPLGGEGIALISAVIFAALSICLAATFSREGRGRLLLGSMTIVLAIIAASGVRNLIVDTGPSYVSEIRTFFVGFLGFQLLANVVRRA